jgi:hypothetical protein
MARWFAEALGGPKTSSSDFGTLLDERFTDEHRARWVTLLKRAADEAGLPTDAEFRSAFTSLLEWESRRVTGPDVSIPEWDWNAAARPSVVSQPPVDDTQTQVVLPGEGEPIAFEQHVKTLFRTRDRQSMLFAFDLWSYEDVAAHADDILERVRAGTMPCDGAWPPEQTDVFARWIEAGKAH